MYRSTANQPFGPDELDDLAFRSQLRNATLAISGYLTHRSGRFTQYLEGPPDAIGALYHAIENDDRHTIDIVVRLGITSRRFPDWSMKVLNPLWHPSAGSLDVIDELLQTSQVAADVHTITPSLGRLLDQVAIDEGY